jgi:hypothetical protein
MVMSLSPAVSAHPSTGAAEEWAVFLRDTDGRADGAI